MKLEELQRWILSEQGLSRELELVARYSAARNLNLQVLASDLADHAPDWRRLLFAGSVLTKDAIPEASETALMVAHAGLLHSGKPKVIDASATLLTQLANHRAIHLAESRGVLSNGLDQRLGTIEQMLLARREL